MPKRKSLLDKNKLVLYFVIIVVAFAAFALSHEEPRVSIKPLNSSNLTETDRLVQENHELRDRLAQIEPTTPVKIVTADTPSAAVETVPTLTVMAEGIRLPFEVVYEDQAWVRPDYEPYWHSKLGQWSKIPDRIHSAYHHLFVSPKSAGVWNETLHESGIAELADKIQLPVYEDEPDNTMAVVALQHKITDVVVLDNQVVVIGTPSRTGLEVISINKQSLIQSVSGELLAKNDNQKYLFQLVTPDGYETDYNNVTVNF